MNEIHDTYDSERTQRILNAAYELEGLMQLARSGRSAGADLAGMIAAKGEEIALLTRAFGSPACTAAAGSEGSDDVEPEPDDTLFYALPDAPADDETADAGASEPEVRDAAVQPSTDAGECPVAEAAEEPVAAGCDSEAQQRRVKPLFSVNDRFRFSRELFGNDRAAFDAALDTLVTFDTYEEAENYFYAELGWQPDESAVADFMEIAGRYFKSN